ncbi:hypothetical protein [Phytopseudomonas dryadis]|uniref:hypothetical protein n=1 Tax=Pseudomonadaceae TaxID=135621 RepID=UPI001037C426|nr:MULTISPECIES: hypothetical protein [Pseudomonas]
MDDGVTFDELFNSLSVGQIWALLAAAFAVISACATGGFWFGQKFSETQGAVEITSIQTRAQLLESNYQSAISSLEQWREAYKNLENEMAKRNGQISQLSGQLARQNNCVFIKNQIRLNKDRMDTIDRSFSFAGDGAYAQRLRQERNELNQENARYQDQLGRCGG